MKLIGFFAAVALAFLAFAIGYEWNVAETAPLALGWFGATIPAVLVMSAYVLGRIP